MIRTNSELLSYVSQIQRLGKWGIVEEEFGPKNKIIEQDQRYSQVHLIKEGIAKCYISDDNGREFIQEFLGAGMEFGELEVFTGRLSICAVESITHLTVFSLSYADFRALVKTDARFNHLVMKALADKIRYKAPRHSYQHSHPIEDNVLRLQELFPDFTRVISKKDIANYIGITVRSLNRALKQLEGAGKLK
ncbi:Crp/Fnr family transcriptional regulator [Flavobacteriaceae bacterium 3-367]